MRRSTTVCEGSQSSSACPCDRQYKGEAKADFYISESSIPRSQPPQFVSVIKTDRLKLMI